MTARPAGGAALIFRTPLPWLAGLLTLYLLV
ncbi:MAG: hypothetical protein QOJ06_1511, partial [Pseudonocardiales bacterium]|nr:hypothetical protein [Pseudonocardiales bacterium]